jgi:histone RNA hairpin-binding protein
MPKREFPVDAEFESFREPLQHGQSSSQKRQKLHVGKSNNVANDNNKNGCANQNQLESMTIRKLDPSIPEEAQRMKTRFKMISKGKNTVGYDEYLKQVPKEKRRKIPEHPVTPDHTLDIPNRRWQGQVKAW